METKIKFRGKGLKRWVPLAGAMIIGLILAGASSAADYPANPIQLIVGYAPGGPASLGARIVADEVSKEIGVPVVLINKGGAQGSIAATLVARSKPDGYTILAGTSANLSAAFALLPDITYKLSDFMPIAQYIVHPMVIAVRNDAPWKTLQDFIDDAKRNPGKYKASSDGGGIAICLEALLQSANLKVPHMLSKGAAPNLKALLGGETQISAISFTSLLPQLEAKSVRILAANRRLKEYPDIRTIAELGYPEIAADFWNGFLVPAGTPAPIFEKLVEVFKKAITNPSTISKLKTAGFVTDYLGPKEFKEYLEKQYEIWMKLGTKYKIVE